MPEMPKVNSTYGAPMGRSGGYSATPEGPVKVFKVVLDSGGYDSGGAYWGIPNNLYCAEDDEGFKHYGRHNNQQEYIQWLKGEFPEITFDTSEYDTYAFVQGYLACAAWCGIDDDDPNKKKLESEEATADDFTKAEVRKAEKECQEFIAANLADLQELDPSACGHDFWLTRNHHGAGFWDRGYGEVGDRLTKASHPYGSTYVYISKRGKLHIEGC